ncbi:ATP-binding cassette domain-containing protein [Streptomyces sp. NPDC017936]|uniref:ATP-binding cassette domain-containing protein n=1 Tax=Streptomyces sp. NPDC017936 TaxID=3365016 RepID=UPI0037B8F423
MDGVGVSAEGFGLKGPRGWAFRNVDVDAEPGSLIVIEGPSGSGRTSLLLALTGRMKATAGTATVGAARLPQQSAAVRRFSALAHVTGVTDLDPALTVGEHLRERALLERRFTGSVRELLRPRAEKAGRTKLRVDAALSAAGLDLASLPKGPRTAVRDLERLEALRLSVALALVGRPRLLGVDDADLKLSAAERAEVHALLASLAQAGTTVVAVCADAPGGAVRITTHDECHETTGTTPADTADTTAAPGATDGTDTADTTETTDATDTADTTETTDGTDTADTTEAADGTDTTEAADGTGTTGGTGTTRATDAQDENADKEDTADALAETRRA